MAAAAKTAQRLPSAAVVGLVLAHGDASQGFPWWSPWQRSEAKPRPWAKGALACESCPMRLFGHRGASAQAPENTRAAFSLALDRGALGVECDLQRLRDAIVVLHDSTLRRTARKCDEALLDAPIDTLSYAQVCDVDIGSWYAAGFASERLLTFPEFLALIASKDGHCLVEVKGGDFEIVERLVKEARASGLSQSRLTFIGFDVQLMRAIKQAAHGDYRCLGIVHLTATGLRWIDEWRALSFLRRCREAGLDGVDFNADARVVTQRVVDQVHKDGMQCFVWVFRAPAKNDVPEVWSQMAALGVDGFTSNCSEEALRWWLGESKRS